MFNEVLNICIQVTYFASWDTKHAIRRYEEQVPAFLFITIRCSFMLQLYRCSFDLNTDSKMNMVKEVYEHVLLSFIKEDV